MKDSTRGDPRLTEIAIHLKAINDIRRSMWKDGLAVDFIHSNVPGGIEVALRLPAAKMAASAAE